MKLNHEKCAFGISVGKFLASLLTEKGIEANLKKIEAIEKMGSPESLHRKNVCLRSFYGKINWQMPTIFLEFLERPLKQNFNGLKSTKKPLTSLKNTNPLSSADLFNVKNYLYTSRYH